jgi:hypothetical protein
MTRMPRAGSGAIVARGDGAAGGATGRLPNAAARTVRRLQHRTGGLPLSESKGPALVVKAGGMDCQALSADGF